MHDMMFKVEELPRMKSAVHLSRFSFLHSGSGVARSTDSELIYGVTPSVKLAAIWMRKAVESVVRACLKSLGEWLLANHGTEEP